MSTQSPASPRDPRLDFFRGIGMFIIFTAHMPGNWLTLWIPARFGFSDATEIFVFCSGMASALAFGRVFKDRGMALGTTRVAFRMWQVYWCHIGLFLAVAASMLVLNRLTPIEDYDYVGYMNLWFFFDDTLTQLPALMALVYVPNYFDILPMYLVLLALIPIVIGLQRYVGTHAALGLIIALWLATQFGLTGLPAEPWSDRVWFFNPFGWGLVFFTGFALGARWIQAPGYDRRLVIAAIAFVILTIPFAYFRILNAVPALDAFRDAYLAEFVTKTQFGLFRYLHFLALAYLAVLAVGARGWRLSVAGWWSPLVAVTMKVGQQSLATFVMGMFAARLVGAAIDHIGSTHLTIAAANFFGWGLLIVTAYVVAWLKSQPWRASNPAKAAA